MGDQYFLTKDGKLRQIRADELYHENWKYIKREKIKGKWVYTYPDDVKSNKKSSFKDKIKDFLGYDERDKVAETKKAYNTATTERVKAQKVLQEATTKADEDDKSYAEDEKKLIEAKNAANEATKKWATSGKEYLEAQAAYKKTAVGKVESLVNKGKALIEKLSTKTEKKSAVEQWKEEQKKSNAEKEQQEAERKAKEEAERKVKEEAERKAKEEAERKQKEYEAAQEKERSEIREPELKALLEKLTDKNIFGKMKNNPLPDLVLKSEATTLDEDMAAINPEYGQDPSNLYNQNCSYCSIAYDLRRRGYDVVAGAEIIGDREDPGLIMTDILKIYGVSDIGDQNDIWVTSSELVRDEGIEATTEAVTDAMLKGMLEHGEGARGIVGVHWKQGGGHAIAWEVVNGEVEIRDCQTNEKIDLIDYMKRSKSSEYIRTDNLTPTEEVYKYVKNRKAG